MRVMEHRSEGFICRITLEEIFGSKPEPDAECVDGVTREYELSWSPGVMFTDEPTGLRFYRVADKLYIEMLWDSSPRMLIEATVDEIRELVA